MRARADWAVTLYLGPGTLACPSEWHAKPLSPHKSLAAPRLPQRFQATLAAAERALPQRHRRAASTIAVRLREVQLQTPVASVGILKGGILMNSAQTRQN